jgi:hypothetical protein
MPKLKKPASFVGTLAAAVAMTACSTNPAVPAGATVQDFARLLDGQRFGFDLSGSIKVPGMSGTLITNQRVPKGLIVALEPANGHCINAGGEPLFTKMQAVGDAQLPLRMLCQRGTAMLWSLELEYRDITRTLEEGATGRRTLPFINMTTRAQLLSPDQIYARLRDEDAQLLARAQDAAAERERQALLEAERQRITREKEAEAKRTAALWPARVAEFRAGLKPGDRFKWVSPPSSAWGGPFIGLVIRVEGNLAFVQFENLTISGQSTRYITKEQLEPYDGPAPQGRYEIK